METIKIRQPTSKGYIECVRGGICDLSYPDSKTRRGRVTDNGKTSPTLTATMAPNVVDWTWNIDGADYEIKIRKLMPIECWRLMGFKDKDFRRAEKVNSKTQLYKQAGNSIVKDVLMYVFARLVNPDIDSKDIIPDDTDHNRKVLYGK